MQMSSNTVIISSVFTREAPLAHASPVHVRAHASIWQRILASFLHAIDS